MTRTLTVAQVPPKEHSDNKDETARLALCLDGVRRHDREALKRLYDLTRVRLMGVASRILKDDAEAADVLQDVYLKVWRQAGDYTGRGSVWGWLVVMTRHAALDQLKSRQRRREEPLDSAGEWPEEAVPETTRDVGIDRCLARLNDHARQAIILSYVHGYSHRELQHRLARPLGTVKAWIRRGLQELKRCLEA